MIPLLLLVLLAGRDLPSQSRDNTGARALPSQARAAITCDYRCPVNGTCAASTCSGPTDAGFPPGTFVLNGLNAPNSPRGVIYYNSFLYATDGTAGVYKIDRTTIVDGGWGATLGNAGGPRPTMLLANGTDIWTTVDVQGRLMAFNASTMSKTYDVASAPNPFGLALVGGNRIWVTGSTNDRLYVHDSADGTLLSTLVASPGSGTGLSGIATCGPYIWVVRGGDGTVQPWNTDGGQLATVTVGSTPEQIACDGTNIWVTATGSGVRKINATTGALVGNFAAGANPRGVLFDGIYIWVANSGGSDVSVLDQATGAIVATVSVETAPWGLTFDGTDVWVTNFSSQTISRVNAR